MALTDDQIANIIFNETRSLSGEQIAEGRKNIAHSIINAQAKSGNRPKTSPTVAHVPKQETETYTACVAGVKAARDDRAKNIDPTRGATNFNFRKNSWRGDFYGLQIQTQVGPLTTRIQQQIFPPRTSTQTHMANKSWLFAPLLLAVGGVFADGQEAQSPNSEICKGRVESSQQCHWIDGTVSIYNGTPSVRIHQRGSKRVYAVGPSEQELMPSDLKSKLTVDNAIDAKLRICPMNKQKQKGLRVVCIDEAKIQKISERQ